MTYQPVPIQEVGGQKRTWSADDEIRYLLRMILAEMRTTNLHLSAMADNEFSSEDMEK